MTATPITTAPVVSAPTAPGAEPAPGSPEALLLLAGLGVLPASAGLADPRFSPDEIKTCVVRLLTLKQEQEALAEEQKQLHDQLRLAHLRGDLQQQLPAGKDGNGYRIAPQTLLLRRPGRKQWRYSLSCKELECQLKARQTYEQHSGEATCSLGASFWEVRSFKD
ncbi:hypothetical protein [Vulcanococcus limneticus]|uniref:hypothetical protein n=1 Tax=Vulcanococcus limneticus TaxID=2170428 RepID=UPI000B997657|nr:hypothetical protein [Vulcanococcus limneticus]MCP9793461.1 hypothetical protein [Vulcanococcus limneticus MW73D5]MCP9898822.1 hypothetical protein [Vulcanococcus limneticus Candia 3B3]